VRVREFGYVESDSPIVKLLISTDETPIPVPVISRRERRDIRRRMSVVVVSVACAG
jgi:hypothetical protein